MDALGQMYGIIAERWVTFATALVFFFSALIVPSALHYVRLSAIPHVGGDIGSLAKRREAYLNSSRDIYNQGYQMFKNGLFRITTSRSSSVVVLSEKFLPELKKLPDSTLSLPAAFKELLEGRYTGVVADNPLLASTIKTQLTPALARLNSTISQEVGEALALEMPTAKDWTEINVNRILMRVVAMASGRIFVGPELCRNEEYLSASVDYAVEVMTAHRAVQDVRPWLRPLLAWRLPEVQQVQKRIKAANNILRPIVEERKRAALDPSWKKPDDMMQWFIDAQGKSKSTDGSTEELATIQLILSFAAIHTTTLTATNVFYDIASLPDFASKVCDEIREALANNDGAFTSSALQSMKMLDSALKETLRLHPPGHASFQRKVLQPFTLSSGQVIPAGVIIEIPAVSINYDSAVFPNADQFDPLRFYKLRQKAREEGSVEASAANQFVSITQSSLTFGYGRHACPGRFFAANEIKMIVAHALLKYDFRLSEGSSERYANIEFAGMSIPDASRRLLCRAKSE